MLSMVSRENLGQSSWYSYETLDIFFYTVNMVNVKKWIRSLKITIPVEYDVSQQREWLSDVSLSNKQVRSIITDYFNKMNYKERQAWINSNAKFSNKRLGRG